MALDALRRHPLSALWGDMPAEDFAGLVEDVREHGVREAITVHDDKVLDGWHRYRAAVKVGIQPPVDLYEGSDPVGFVISQNAHRRHLTATQKAAIVAQARAWAPAGFRPDRDRQGANDYHPEDQPRTNEELAREAGVKVGTMRKVKQRIREGHGEALARGETTLAKLAKEERDKLAMKDTVTRPLTRMERLEAETERLRLERDALAEENNRLRAEIAALKGGAIE